MFYEMFVLRPVNTGLRSVIIVSVLFALGLPLVLL